MVNYGANIRKLRIAKGIKACYVAKRLNLTPGGYSDIERGRRKLSAERAAQIANILGVDIRQIFLGANVSETRNNNANVIINATGTE